MTFTWHPYFSEGLSLKLVETMNTLQGDPKKTKEKIFHRKFSTPYFHWDLKPGLVVKIEIAV